MNTRIEAIAVRLYKTNAEFYLASLEKKAHYEALDIVEMEKEINTAYAAAGIQPDAVLAARIRDAARNAHMASAAESLSRLENISAPTEDAYIEESAENIRQNYEAAGLKMDVAMAARLHTALSQAHKTSAAAWLHDLAKLDSPIGIVAIDRNGKEALANLKSAGVTIDAVLEARIRDTVAAAQRTSADRRLEGLEKEKDPNSAESVQRADKTLRAQYAAAGIAIDAALEARIRAAAVAAYKANAASSMREMAEADYNERLEEGEYQVRASFRLAGIPIDTALEALIQKALVTGHRHVAESRLEYLEKSSPGYSPAN